MVLYGCLVRSHRYIGGADRENGSLNVNMETKLDG